jgi:hypothetical protein
MKKYDWLICLILGFGIAYWIWGRKGEIETVYEPTQELLELENRYNELEQRNDSLQHYASYLDSTYNISRKRSNAELSRIRSNYPDYAELRSGGGMDTGRYATDSIVTRFRQQVESRYARDSSYWALYRAEIRDGIRE